MAKCCVAARSPFSRVLQNQIDVVRLRMVVHKEKKP